MVWTRVENGWWQDSETGHILGNECNKQGPGLPRKNWNDIIKSRFGKHWSGLGRCETEMNGFTVWPNVPVLSLLTIHLYTVLSLDWHSFITLKNYVDDDDVQLRDRSFAVSDPCVCNMLLALRHVAHNYLHFNRLINKYLFEWDYSA